MECDTGEKQSKKLKQVRMLLNSIFNCLSLLTNKEIQKGKSGRKGKESVKLLKKYEKGIYIFYIVLYNQKLSQNVTQQHFMKKIS